MDKKSWPWKKKLPDKMSSPELSDSSQHCASNQTEEQFETSTASSDETSSDSSLKVAGDLMAEVSTKDDLVKQHMKIAEEAVAGWEKAEAEAADLKEKLEVAIQQKVAAEDRVSHLDGALKECMKQLRHVREEQEQKIHDVVVKKTREWEKVRIDLEARLDDATNELCEALAENQAMSKSHQERAETIAELSDAKACLESDSSLWQVRLASLEKENARLKYELQVLSKELELRTEERDYVKRAEEAASKHNLEKTKKIAKLDDDCQRLRLLVKRRQPSPVPNSHAKGDPDVVSSDRIRRRSPCRRSTTSLPFKPLETTVADFGFNDRIREENKLLSEHLQAVQKESKSLRELLVKKDNELQTVRQLHRRMTSKHPNTEDNPESYPYSGFSSKPVSVTILSRSSNSASMDHSIASVSGESGGGEDVHADSWASALMAELAQIKTESKVQDPLSIDLMDDFAEMERLASLSSPDNTSKLRTAEDSEELVSSCVKSVVTLLDEKLLETNRESAEQEAVLGKDKCCGLKDMSEKLPGSDAIREELQQLLALYLGVEADGILLSKAVDAAKRAIECESSAGTEHLCNTVSYIESNTLWAANGTSQEDPSTKGAGEVELHGVGAELALAMQKVLDILDSVGQNDYSFPYFQRLRNGPNPELACGKDQWSSGLQAYGESLINLCNSLVQGEVDLIDFVAEVVSGIDWLVGQMFTPSEKSPIRNGRHRVAENCNEQVDSSDSEMISAESSPTQLLCSPGDGDGAKANIEPQDVLPDQSSISNLSFQFSESSTLEEDMSKAVSEVVALKSNLEAETKKSNRYESEILRLKVVNNQLESNYELTMQKLADLECQVNEANQKLHTLTDELVESQNRSSELESQLRDALNEKQYVEGLLSDFEHSKGILDSELSIARENVEALGRRALSLEEALNEEVSYRKEVEMQLMELKEEQRERVSDSISISAENEATRIKKEQEIAAAAERLAECQQTILDLGKHLKALGVTKDVLDAPFGNLSKTTHNPPSTPTRRLLSASDNAHISTTSTSMETLCNEEPITIVVSRIEKDGEHEQRGIVKASGISQHTGRFCELEVGSPAAKRGVQAKGRHQRQAQPVDYQKGYNRFPSPTYGDKDGGPVLAIASNPNTTTEPVMNSPMRSPARFLSLRGKNVNAHEQLKHGDSDAAEKHVSSGLSRFFTRTKSGH